MLDDFIPLIVMPEHHHLISERPLGIGDAAGQFLVGQQLILSNGSWQCRNAVHGWPQHYSVEGHCTTRIRNQAMKRGCAEDLMSGPFGDMPTRAINPLTSWKAGDTIGLQS